MVIFEAIDKQDAKEVLAMKAKGGTSTKVIFSPGAPRCTLAETRGHTEVLELLASERIKGRVGSGPVTLAIAAHKKPVTELPGQTHRPQAGEASPGGQRNEAPSKL